AHKAPYRFAMRFNLLCMQEPAQGKKHRKNVRRRNCHRMGLRRGGCARCPSEERLTINHSWQFVLYARSIAGPQFQSALNESCSYLQVLGNPTCPCKFLKTLVIYTLKRLASAVQLRPWPPSFNHLEALKTTITFQNVPICAPPDVAAHSSRAPPRPAQAPRSFDSSHTLQSWSMITKTAAVSAQREEIRAGGQQATSQKERKQILCDKLHLKKRVSRSPRGLCLAS